MTSTAALSLVPRPLRVERGDGAHPLGGPITAEPETASAAALLRPRLAGSTGPGISIGLDPALGAEAYELRTGPDGTRLVGGDAAGAYYAAQTLLQLLPPAVYSGPARWQVPEVRIADRPAFGWRGSMLDVGRHFMPVDFILRYIELLAMHKLNVLHLHLTEDQGWRLQIDAHPKLTAVGSCRAETVLARPEAGHPENNRYDRIVHEGFYTKADIATIVAHAARHHVRVVPEINVPGHSQAAIAAYPELGNTGQALPVGTAWGIVRHVLNAEESTVQFYREVFDEVFEMFDSEFVHAGGDECPRDEWRESERAQKRKAELGLSEDGELQAWFVASLAEHFATRGRRLVGWDEIIEGRLPAGAVVMSWRGEAGGIAAARAGYDVVMASKTHTYFDYYQTGDRTREPYAIGGLITLEKAYEHRPVPAELSATEAEHVLGAQFQVWTEYIPTPAQVEYMAFPRGCAFAETVWHPDPGDYPEFLDRMATHARRLQALGVAYHPLPSGAG